jgi:Holliday junction resolvasome RuvABC endonuclease subunit
MGLDLSLTGSGICVVDSHYDVVCHETVGRGLKRPALKDEVERLIYIRDRIRSLAKGFNPDVVVVENYTFKAIGRGYQLGELGGTIKTMLFEELGRLPYVVFPNQCRALILGKGKGQSKKEEVIEWVKWATPQMTWNTDDEMDAYVLARAGCVIEIVMKNREGCGYPPEIIELVDKLEENRMQKPKPKTKAQRKRIVLGT